MIIEDGRSKTEKRCCVAEALAQLVQALLLLLLRGDTGRRALDDGDGREGMAHGC